MEAWSVRSKQDPMSWGMGAMGFAKGAGKSTKTAKDHDPGQAFDGSQTARMTTTVCMSFPGEIASSLDPTVMDEVNVYGDVCRIDMSLAAVFKCVLVTFFDVRSAVMMLHQNEENSKPFPASVMDCRTVRVKLNTFFEGLANFGDVAYQTIVGNYTYVEYYDLRAAQMLLAAARESAQPVVPTGQVQQPVPWLQQQSLGMLGGMPSSPLGGDSPGVSGVVPPPGLSLDADECQEEMETASGRTDANGARSSPTTNDTANSGANNSNQSNSDGDKDQMDGPPQSPTSHYNGRFAYTKVSGKEFSKYDIDLDRIQQGKDPRTTVMVRNLMGAHARESMMQFLERFGLAKRYTFFYMPCKERKKTPTGFAFINFMEPCDVSTLYTSMKAGAWYHVITSWTGKGPEVSYARVQGHEELASHFRSSAVLHEWDPSKRPIFKNEAPGKQAYSPKDERSNTRWSPTSYSGDDSFGTPLYVRSQGGDTHLGA